jgi:NOL1/NOP2/sun family putative RNA methylase
MLPIPGEITRHAGLSDDPAAFLEALHRPLPTDLRWNPLAVDRERFENMLEREGTGWDRPFGSDDLYRVTGLPGPGLTWAYHLGWYHPQGYTSTLPPAVLAPRTGENVLDLCAAPGGKTSQLAAMMQGEGLVVANDISIGRLSVLAANLERLRVPNALLSRYRGESLPESLSFDRVLVDAPCSGEGTFRIEGGRWREDPPEAVRKLPGVQLRLLQKAFRLVRPGGLVCYSTCTYAPEEDEGVVAALLETTGAEVVPLPEGLSGTPGITEWEEATYPSELARTRRFWPHHTDSWGFYVALLRRRD